MTDLPRGRSAGVARASAERLPLATGSVDMIFADPPYLREYLHTYGWLAAEAMRVLKPGGFVLAMCGGAYVNQIFRMFDNAGLTFYWQYQLELVDQATGIYWPRGNSQVHVSVRQKSVIAYSKGPSLARTCTTSKFRSNGGDKRFHFWGQDVASARYYIDCFSEPGDLIVDPFVGGGTTMAAARLIGRRCVGFDVDTDALVTTRYRMSGKGGLAPAEMPLFAGAAS